MCLYSIATEYNGPLEAAHAQIDDDRYDMVECGAAGKPTVDLSDQLHCSNIAPTSTHIYLFRRVDLSDLSQGCSITSVNNYCMSIANQLHGCNIASDTLQLKMYIIATEYNGPLEAAHAQIDLQHRSYARTTTV